MRQCRTVVRKAVIWTDDAALPEVSQRKLRAAVGAQVLEGGDGALRTEQHNALPEQGRPNRGIGDVRLGGDWMPIVTQRRCGCRWRFREVMHLDAAHRTVYLLKARGMRRWGREIARHTAGDAAKSNRWGWASSSGKVLSAAGFLSRRGRCARLSAQLGRWHVGVARSR